jgi:hypothetical protein
MVDLIHHKGEKKMNSFDSIQCEETFQMITFWFSDCCMETMDSVQVDHEVCPCCGEHCEVITEEFPIPVV